MTDHPDTHFEIHPSGILTEDDAKRFLAWLFEMVADNEPFPPIPAEQVRKRIEELREEAQDER